MRISVDVGGLTMALFQSFSGVVTGISDFGAGIAASAGCYRLMTVEDGAGGVVNFVVAPTTYFVDHAMIMPGDTVIGFYDANAATPLIYPPQFRAIVMARVDPGRSVKVDYFDAQLLSGDGTLRLNIAPSTAIVLENGQFFGGNPANRDLIVVYGPTTRSIPAQTAPWQIVVLCER